MAGTKIQVGYGSDSRKGGKYGQYGSRKTGKVLHNGGFSFQPTVSYESISEERWNEIFPKKVNDAQTV